MAAPCATMASRAVLRLLSWRRGAAGVGNAARRPFCSASVHRASPRTATVAEKATSPWSLTAAVCLQRLPVVSADCAPIEQQFKELMFQMEMENSLLSDHELRLVEDAERMSRREAGDYDSDGEGDHQEIIFAQDLEDVWEQKLKRFQPAPRVRDDVDRDPTSPARCLADALVLLAERQVGGEKLWLLPQSRWQEGETLRRTAERALASVPAAGLKATFLGNAPCGVYKYRLPAALRTASSLGAKVFFFKAVVSDGAALAAAPDPSVVWARKSELQRYLKPAYAKTVERFVL